MPTTSKILQNDLDCRSVSRTDLSLHPNLTSPQRPTSPLYTRRQRSKPEPLLTTLPVYSIFQTPSPNFVQNAIDPDPRSASTQSEAEAQFRIKIAIEQASPRAGTLSPFPTHSTPCFQTPLPVISRPITLNSKSALHPFQNVPAPRNGPARCSKLAARERNKENSFLYFLLFFFSFRNPDSKHR